MKFLNVANAASSICCAIVMTNRVEIQFRASRKSDKASIIAYY